MKKFIGVIVIIFIMANAINAYAYCTPAWVRDVNPDGTLVILNDDTVWAVEQDDTQDASSWLPSDEIAACGDILINANSGDKIDATRLR